MIAHTNSDSNNKVCLKNETINITVKNNQFPNTKSVDVNNNQSISETNKNNENKIKSNICIKNDDNWDNLIKDLKNNSA